jgi:integrase/recombinase XerD
MPVGPRTQQAYLACVRQWAEYFKTAPELITTEQLRQYFIHLKCIKKVARQTSTQALCAIKLFWEKSLRRVWPTELELVRAQPRFKLPVILSAEEVRQILGCVGALDQRD